MRHGSPRRSPSRRIAALLLPAAILAAFGAPAPAGAQGPAATPPGVVVTRATEITFPLTVEGLGTLRANESIEIRPRITETVTAIRFTEGQEVAAGAVIVELRSAEVRAQVAAAKAALAESESRYQRSRHLYEDQLVSQAELEPLEAQRDGDRADLDAAEARLAETVVRAPFAGRLGLRRVSLGSLVGPGDVITTLDDTHVMKIDFDVPETAVARLRTGLSFVATSAAFPDTQFRGVVVSVDTRVDPVSRTITVRGTIPNPKGRLKPGMFMSVRLLREDIVALVVPEQALVPEQSRMFVWVVGADANVEKREVRIGRRRPGQVEILSGLRAGETVITEGTQKARPGQPVEVLERREMRP